jgi:type VI secretion system protein ImpC
MTENQDVPELEVNLSYPDGLRVSADQPYRIVLIADFAGSPDAKLSGPLASGVVDVTPETFDELLAAARPRASFTLADPTAPGSVMAAIEVCFDSARAFEPDPLLDQLPATKSLMAVREQLVARMRGQCSAADLSAACAKAVSQTPELAWLPEALKAAPAAPAADPAAVDAMLDQFDLGDEESDRPQSGRTPMGSLVSTAAGAGAIPSEEASAIRRALAEIDRRANAWLTAVLHMPQIQAIEGAWRSLGWLLGNIDFRKGVRLSVLHAPREELIDRITSQIIDPVFDEGAPAPHLIAVDMLFANTAPDMETLDQLAQHAASLPAVALVGAGPALLGVKHAWQVATLPPLVSMFDQWQFAKWKTLRSEYHARYLGVVFGRFLLRAPYRRDDASDLAFNYREPCIGEKDFVWASGAVAGAYTVARSVAQSAWPCGMAGRLHGRVEGLPRALAGKNGDKWFGPADTQLPEGKFEELGIAGLNAITTTPDGEDAILWNGLTAARPHRADASALLEVSLPYQLFAARLSTLLFDLKPHLEGKDPQTIVKTVHAHVSDWLKLKSDTADESLTVQTRDAEDDPNALQLAVTVAPPQNILPGGIPVVMGYKIAKT